MKINFKSLYVTVLTTTMTAAQRVAAGERTSDLLIRKQACEPLGHPAPKMGGDRHTFADQLSKEMFFCDCVCAYVRACECTHMPVWIVRDNNC